MHDRDEWGLPVNSGLSVGTPPGNRPPDHSLNILELASRLFSISSLPGPARGFVLVD